MNKTQIIFGIKIFIAMVIAFFVVSFLPNNPRSTVLYLAKKINYIKLSLTPIPAMKQISKGVYAKEDKDLGTVYIKVTKDVKQTEQTIESNGHKIKIIYIK